MKSIAIKRIRLRKLLPVWEIEIDISGLADNDYIRIRNSVSKFKSLANGDVDAAFDDQMRRLIIANVAKVSRTSQDCN